MDRFLDGAKKVVRKELKPKIHFQIFSNFIFYKGAWRFLVASSTEHATYLCAHDYRVKVGRWTKRKQFIHKSMCYTFWLALERFKEDMVLEDTMSNHILFAPFALLTRANLRELYM